jgi:ribosomal protein S1
VQDYGVFVAFCNGVKGLAPASHLGLEPGEDASKHFPIGKVAHCLCF